MTQKDRKQVDARRAGDLLVSGHVSEDPFAAAFKATRMPMIVTDPNQHDNPIIFCNAAFNKLTGYENDEIIGNNCRMLQGPGSDPDVISKMRSAIAAGEDVAVDILNYRKDGTPFWNAVFISPVRDAAGKIMYFFASQLDFTHVKSREADLAAARHKAEEEVASQTANLRAALAAKSLLVHEVDHRVKNNLLTMASIVKMQARVTADQGQKDALMSVLNRIEALSTVQRKLFTLDDVSKFDISEFTRELVTDLVGATGRTDISLSLDLSPVHVPAVKATPLSLIVNELVGTAVRRGLSAGGGDIHVSVKRTNGHFVISVEDTSIPVVMDTEHAEFSEKLLEASALQLGAKIERKFENQKTIVNVTLLVEANQEVAH